MTMIDGKAIASEKKNDLKKRVQELSRAPKLVVILVGNDPASAVYVRAKQKACEACGILSDTLLLPDETTQEELVMQIQQLNCDESVDGILVQQPLPKQIAVDIILEAVLPEKDVDGFHPINVGRLSQGNFEGFVPCTPLGVMEMLKASKIETEGKHVVIIGRSNIVGKPMAALLLQKDANATVTIAHSRTQNLEALTRTADILIAAIGRPEFVKREMIKPGAVVIDVGINRQDGKLVGDVDFNGVSEIASSITPVPGGVGPMTIAMLLENTYLSAKRRGA